MDAPTCRTLPEETSRSSARSVSSGAVSRSRSAPGTDRCGRCADGAEPGRRTPLTSASAVPHAMRVSAPGSASACVPRAARGPYRRAGAACLSQPVSRRPCPCRAPVPDASAAGRPMYHRCAAGSSARPRAPGGRAFCSRVARKLSAASWTLARSPVASRSSSSPRRLTPVRGVPSVMPRTCGHLPTCGKAPAVRAGSHAESHERCRPDDPSASAVHAAMPGTGCHDRGRTSRREAWRMRPYVAAASRQRPARITTPAAGGNRAAALGYRGGRG